MKPNYIPYYKMVSISLQNLWWAVILTCQCQKFTKLRQIQKRWLLIHKCWRALSVLWLDTDTSLKRKEISAKKKKYDVEWDKSTSKKNVYNNQETSKTVYFHFLQLGLFNSNNFQISLSFLTSLFYFLFLYFLWQNCLTAN